MIRRFALFFLPLLTVPFCLMALEEENPSSIAPEAANYQEESAGDADRPTKAKKSFTPFVTNYSKQAVTKHGGVYCKKTGKPVVFKHDRKYKLNNQKLY